MSDKEMRLALLIIVWRNIIIIFNLFTFNIILLFIIVNYIYIYIMNYRNCLSNINITYTN